MTVRVLIGAGAALLLTVPAAAQQVSFRLGGLRARYADSLTGDAGSLGARATWEGQRARGVLDASYARFASGGGALQTWASAQVARATGSRTGVGLHVEGLANGTSYGLWTGSATGGAFGAVAMGAWVATLDVTAGGVRTVDSMNLGTGALALRVRRSIGDLTVFASAVGTVASGARYADASVGADWRHARMSAGILSAGRTGDLGTAPWLQAYGEYRLTTRFALEAAFGSYPRDLTGFARGFYVNAGVRVVLPHAGRAEAALAAAPPAVVVTAVGADSTRVTFTVQGADSVSIAGSWNDWTPAPLAHADQDRWTAVLPVGAGTWRFALVAGERWFVPAGVTSLPDDFGGQVGVLVRR